MTVQWFEGTEPCWLRSDCAFPVASVEVHGGGPICEALREDLSRLARHDPLNPHAVRLRIGTLADLAAAGRNLDPGLLNAVEELGPEGFAVDHDEDLLTLTAPTPAGLRYALGWLLRAGALPAAPFRHAEQPRIAHRVLDQWDNMTDGPMGTVERGNAGDTLFFTDGRVRSDLTRVRDYARLLSSVGINAVCLNNVNVHAVEARLLDEHLSDVARIGEVFAAYGVATLLSVDYSAPIGLGGLDTADPLDYRVAAWWADALKRVATSVPGFGGVVVKADSENRPGPHTYGRTHADGANALARALEPWDALVYWRCFVYDCHQDWRDRGTDRARAAFDHFTPLDGHFADNVVLQVKNGPIDFQVREPVSPLIHALPRTGLALEFQVTQEYTGQQRHVCYLGPQWRQVLDFDFAAGTAQEARTVAGHLTDRNTRSAIVAVANVGTDANWTGHHLAQANLYAFGRLAWDPSLDPGEIAREWIAQTHDLPAAEAAELLGLLNSSWAVYESYTAPLGVGFMVRPGHHYGPDVDGYEYTPWGTYHFADRDGIGVDRTQATGTGFTAQYPAGWARTYEDLATCPDEVLLFFRHVDYRHRLQDGRTVIQHIYDSRFAGVEAVEGFVDTWERLRPHLRDAVADGVAARLQEQLRSAVEWRDQVNTYFLRKSGIPDERGRHIF